MKEIIISTQEQLDQLKYIEKDQYVIIESEKELSLSCMLEVFGVLMLKTKLQYNGYSVVARESSSVEAWESSRVVAWGSSSVVAWGSSRVEAWESSSVEAWGSSRVVARGSSRVVARGSSSVVAWESSRVEAWESSSVEAWGSSSIHVLSTVAKVILFGFSVAFKNVKLKCKIQVKSKTAIIQNVTEQDFFDRHGIKKTKTVTLYKRVSHDYKTQENTKNETLWAIGSTVTHPNWNPSSGECGEGKFHACATAYFCDEFRSNADDRYVAIRVNMSDVHEWTDNPAYPHKIAFRKCKVVYECNQWGEKI